MAHTHVLTTHEELLHLRVVREIQVEIFEQHFGITFHGDLLEIVHRRLMVTCKTRRTADYVEEYDHKIILQQRVVAKVSSQVIV